jgi:hypothetical protein
MLAARTLLVISGAYLAIGFFMIGAVADIDPNGGH